MSVGMWIALSLAGGVGAVARALATHVVNVRVGRAFPYGTLAVNVSGAFALGALSAAGLSASALAVCGTGFLGGYTTFSTWMYESTRSHLVANIAVSAVLGLTAVWVGRMLVGG